MPTGSPATSAKSKPGRALAARKPVGYTLLALAILALGYLSFLQNPSVDLARSVPANVGVFVEVPSLRRLLSSMAKVAVSDPDTTASQTADATAGALSGAFQLTRGDADAINRSIVGAALAARAQGSGVASVWLVAFSSNSAPELLLGSNRLTDDGPVGKSGKGYRVAALTATAPHALDASALDKWLRTLSTQDNGKRLAWFAAAHTLVFGDDALVHEVADVIDGGATRLADSPLWKRARDASLAATPGAEGLFFANEVALRDFAPLTDQKKLFDGFARDGGAVSGSFHFGPAGLVVQANIPVSGDGLQEGKGVVAASKLTFPGRFPANTAALVALSTHRDLDAVGTKAQLLRSGGAAEGLAGVDFAKTLTDFEASIGTPIDEIVRMTGDEAAVGVVLAKDFKYSATSPLLREGLSSAGVVVAIKVDSDVAALRVLARLREAFELSPFGRLANLSTDGPGFIARPRADATAKMLGLLGGGLPTLQVRYKKKEVVAVLAQQAMLDATFAALDEGKETLAGDAAYTLAMGALRPGARAYAWLDLGRVASLVYAANPGARLDAKSRGWPVDAMTLTGPKRITQALALDYRADGTSASASIEALNAWGPALVSGWLLSVPGARPPGAPLPAPSPSATSSTPLPPTPVPLGLRDPLESMPICQRVLKRLAACEASAPTPEARAEFVQREADYRAKFAKTVASRWTFENAVCSAAFFKLSKDPNCPVAGFLLPTHDAAEPR